MTETHIGLWIGLDEAVDKLADELSLSDTCLHCAIFSRLEATVRSAAAGFAREVGNDDMQAFANTGCASDEEGSRERLAAVVPGCVRGINESCVISRNQRRLPGSGETSEQRTRVEAERCFSGGGV